MTRANLILIEVYSHGRAGHDFVSAILDDPLSSDATLRPAILERWKTYKRSKSNILVLE